MSKVLTLAARALDAAWREQRYSQYRERYDIAPSAEFNGPGIKFYGDESGVIRMGERSYIGQDSRVEASRAGTVSIGAGCAISHYVYINTVNRKADQDLSESVDSVKLQRGDVEISDYVWIGAYVFIVEGTTIGENAVVGAHSVVTDDIPPHSICAGTPARVHKFKSYLSSKEKSELATEYRDVLTEELAERYREE